MGVKLFVISLFLVSIFSFFSEIVKQKVVKNNKDNPLITFTDATMYTMNYDEVLRIVEAKTAIRYKSRDEMYDATIVNRVKNKNNGDAKDIISAQKMVKKDELYTLLDDVKYNRDNFLSLRTNELYYDIKKEIAYNSIPFQAVYKGDILNGKKLYLENKTKFLTAEKSHFEINMNNQQTKKNQGKK
jgi:hypothetical protein